MLFELNPKDQRFRAILNGENPKEVVLIGAALGRVSTDGINLEPVTVEGVRIIEGELKRDYELRDARCMVLGALDLLYDGQRSADNDSLEFRFIQE